MAKVFMFIRGQKMVDEKGQTIVEYILLIGAVMITFLLIGKWGVKILQGYFGFLAFLYSGFMTLFP